MFFGGWGIGQKQKALEQWQRNGTGADEMRALCERCEALLADATRLAASDTAPQQQAPQQQSALEAEVQALREKVAHYERGEDYDPQAVRVLHLTANPHRDALIARNQQLEAQLAALTSGAAASETATATTANTATGTTTGGQVVLNAERHAERLIESFTAQAQELREVVCAALGYEIASSRPHEYTLVSNFAEQRSDAVVVTVDPQTGALRIAENDYVRNTLMRSPAVWAWMVHQRSIPGMLAQLTLELLEMVTRA